MDESNEDYCIFCESKCLDLCRNPFTFAGTMRVLYDFEIENGPQEEDRETFLRRIRRKTEIRMMENRGNCMIIKQNSFLCCVCLERCSIETYKECENDHPEKICIGCGVLLEKCPLCRCHYPKISFSTQTRSLETKNTQSAMLY